MFYKIRYWYDVLRKKGNASMKTQRDIPHLTIDQINHLLEAAPGQTCKTLLTLAITTGMRLGELRGLRWQDIDMQNETIDVSRMISVNGEREIRETARTIAIP